MSADDIRDRIVMRLVNEAAKCMQEGVVSESWMVDLGMVLGTGFAPFLGGPLRMCELRGFGDMVAKLEYFQKTEGARFAPAQWLIDQIEHRTEHHSTQE
jgi:3-hydroxyacyl-CoA dehydrogenase/enoyl-CoA hydratase/3-hydroxybutyryl-CoA epimerase